MSVLKGLNYKKARNDFVQNITTCLGGQQASLNYEQDFTMLLLIHFICFTPVLKIGNREDSQKTPRVSNYSRDKHITSIIYHVEVSLCIEKKVHLIKINGSNH